MLKYILKRLGQMLVVIMIVTVAVFFMTSMLPGDPVYLISGDSSLTQEEYDIMYHELMLDKPIPVRFVKWLGGVLQGDFGNSYTYKMPVWELISQRIPVTLYLSVLSLLISMIVGILFGILTAVKRGKLVDTIITLLANVCSCLPQFWIGIVLLFFFCIKNQILPSLGFGWPSQVGWSMHIKTIIMPLFCLSLGGVASYTRQTRSSMLEAIHQDYVRTARSKGVPERKVIFKHVLKNGLIPIVTITGNRLAMLLGGSMFVETVFSLPGLGMLVVRSINGRDIPTIQALVLLLTLVSCLAYIITDIMYVVVDPRISLLSEDK